MHSIAVGFGPHEPHNGAHWAAQLLCIVPRFCRRKVNVVPQATLPQPILPCLRRGPDRGPEGAATLGVGTLAGRRVMM